MRHANRLGWLEFLQHSYTREHELRLPHELCATYRRAVGVEEESARMLDELRSPDKLNLSTNEVRSGQMRVSSTPMMAQ